MSLIRGTTWEDQRYYRYGVNINWGGGEWNSGSGTQWANDTATVGYLGGGGEMIMQYSLGVRVIGAGTIKPKMRYIEPGLRYWIHGLARGDGGTGIPAIYLGGETAWTGTNSTSWQRFSFSKIAKGGLFRVGSTGAGWCEFIGPHLRTDVRCGSPFYDAARYTTWDNLWFQYDSYETLLATNLVSTWYDISGQGTYDLTATFAQRATSVANQLNGLPANRFDGVNNQYSLALPWVQPIHIFLVANIGSLADTRYIFDGTASLDSMALYRSGGDLIMKAGVDGPSRALPGAGAHLIEGQFNGASSKLIIDDGPAGTGTVNAVDPDGITLGSGRGGVLRGAFDAFTLLAFSSIQTGTQRDRIIDYLQARYAL